MTNDERKQLIHEWAILFLLAPSDQLENLVEALKKSTLAQED